MARAGAQFSEAFPSLSGGLGLAPDGLRQFAGELDKIVGGARASNERDSATSSATYNVSYIRSFS